MRVTFVLPMTLLAAPALAQSASAPPPDAPAANATAEPAVAGTAEPADPDQIVVIATRLKDSLIVPQAPVITLNEQDVAAYGVSSIADLITALAPQTNSGRGRGGGFPAILVNGQRIASFRELRDYPPEAIRRVEVLPEEVALKYGFSPDQRVINFILKDNFSSRSSEIEYKQPGQGGTSTGSIKASTLVIKGPQRINATFTLDHTSPLTEAERGVIQQPGMVPTVAGDLLPADYRTLVAKSTDIGGNLTLNHALGKAPDSGSVAINMSVTRSRSESYSGLTTLDLVAPDGSGAVRSIGEPLSRRSDTLSLSAGATFSKPIGNWQLTFTNDGTHSENTQLIARRPSAAALQSLVGDAAAGTLAIDGPLPALGVAGTDRATSNSDSLTSLATLIGEPVRLPAGEVSLTLRAGYAYSAIASTDTRTATGAVDLKRGDLSAGFNLGVPLASRRNDALSELGDLTLNFSAGLDHLSDFGRLFDWSAGITWAPAETLTLSATYIVNDQAPSLANLGNPQVLTLNVPVYDFNTGKSALVTVVSGGNRGLTKEMDRDFKLSLNWQLPLFRNSNLIIEYFRNRSSNITSAFPVLTPAIEAAFPGRVTRDAAGNLTQIDQRPITLAGQEASRIRAGFNLMGNLGRPNDDEFGFGGGGARKSGGARGGPRGGGGGGPRFGGGNGQGRWNVSLFDTVQFVDRVTIAPGAPVLNLLGGDALTGGGVARNTIELDAGGFYRGIGMRFSGTYASPTRVNGSDGLATSDLRFGSLTKLNYRLFVNLGQQRRLTRASRFFRGARMSVFVNNILDARQKVTDGIGAVPLSYQPDLIDPQGRVIGIELRKMF